MEPLVEGTAFQLQTCIGSVRFGSQEKSVFISFTLFSIAYICAIEDLRAIRA